MNIQTAFTAEQAEAISQACYKALDGIYSLGDDHKRASADLIANLHEVRAAAWGVLDYLAGHEGFEYAPAHLQTKLDQADYEPLWRAMDAAASFALITKGHRIYARGLA